MFKTAQALLGATILDEYDWLAKRSIAVQISLNLQIERAVERGDFASAEKCRSVCCCAFSVLGRAHFQRHYPFLPPLTHLQESSILDGYIWNGCTDERSRRSYDLSEMQSILEFCESEVLLHDTTSDLEQQSSQT